MQAWKYLPDIVASDIRRVFAVSFSTETSTTESDTLGRLYILLYSERELDAVNGGESNEKAP